MTTVGLVGWRGMVGSVLLDRMRAERDLAEARVLYYSASSPGAEAPQESAERYLLDANDPRALARCDVILTCQGSGHTRELYGRLRSLGWRGYWIDASSALRLDDEAVIVLDPVNRDVIDAALAQGKRTFVGGNCTVSLLIMAFAGLLRAGLVEWIHTSTYQAASGAGAAKMIELMQQMEALGRETAAWTQSPGRGALDLERRITAAQAGTELPTAEFGAPLAGSLLPWIDSAMPGGQTREEWKGEVELNKILGTPSTIGVDGICVRVGALRCHSQSVLVKMKRPVPIPEVEQLLGSAHPWVRVVANDQEQTLRLLTPAAISGSLDVAVGRLHAMRMGQEFLGAFTVGDQLLWGAAEPLRRMLRIVLDTSWR
ncbi:MAG: aspartate-semialdehyde dehydrogenase [Candidatus Schekmanbacteria bacterium]|nr:aspartate-semialdehyde dehydrogenase [Candidatus Schekmanbacteria bacterium]